MKTQNDGGPAFPLIQEETIRCSGPNEAARVEAINKRRQGMSLRDWFAGMALQSEAITQVLEWKVNQVDWQERCNNAAENAYTIADAMLVERSK